MEDMRWEKLLKRLIVVNKIRKYRIFRFKELFEKKKKKETA